VRSRDRATPAWKCALVSLCALLSTAVCRAQEAISTAAADDPQTVATEEQSPAGPGKVILLPVDFTVYESGFGGTLEAVPDWTTAARANLTQSAAAVLQSTVGLELVPVPELIAAEQAVLRDHLGLTRLIVAQGSSLTGTVWKQRRATFDRALGDGMRFLKERSGADFAMLLYGRQVKQSGGSVLGQLALAGVGAYVPGGGGTQLSASLVDLGAGQVQWFNSSLGVQIFGIGGDDIRKSEVTDAALRELFEPYPEIPALRPD
jgi:hypothetical protein